MENDDVLTPEGSRALAVNLRELLAAAARHLGTGHPSPLVGAVTEHLGVGVSHVVSVSASFPAWEHASLQRGVDGYLAAHTPDATWFGVTGSGRYYEDTVSLLTDAQRDGSYQLGAVDLTTAAVGPAEVMEVVGFGLVASRSPDGSPVVVGVREDRDHHDGSECHLTVLAADQRAAADTRSEVERLMRERDVLRGHVLAFGSSEHRGNQLLTFLPRPALRAEDVVLPDGVLDEVEQHVVGIAEHSAALLAAGQHVKRGLLLHGPPGTGKTHTVRYLMARLPTATVIVLTGPAMKLVGDAVALARRLAPAVVVIEDVDLVAMDRDHGSGGGPLLFTLLDAMDGIGADADVTFVLTTNRAADLERALVERPGRIDLAVEVPRPDAAGRRRLLELYAGKAPLTADLAPVVAATEGVTASFVKELLRLAVLEALRGDAPGGAPGVGDRELAAALDRMTGERSALTRTVLGAGSAADA